MSDSSDTHPLVKIIHISQEIEHTLEKRYGASGNGLGLKLTSVEDKIPAPVCKIIRRIASIRNKAAHHDVGVAEENVERVDEYARYVAAAFAYPNEKLAVLGKAYDWLQGIVDVYSNLLVKKYGADENQSLNAKINSVEKKLPKGVVGKLHKIASYHNKASFADLTVAYKEREVIANLDQKLKIIFQNAGKNKPSGAKNQKKRVSYSSKGRSNQPRRQAYEVAGDETLPAAGRSKQPRRKTSPRRRSNPSYPRLSGKRGYRPSGSSASSSSVWVYVSLGIFIALVIFGVVLLCRAMAS